MGSHTGFFFLPVLKYDYFILQRHVQQDNRLMTCNAPADGKLPLVSTVALYANTSEDLVYRFYCLLYWIQPAVVPVPGFGDRFGPENLRDLSFSGR